MAWKEKARNGGASVPLHGGEYVMTVTEDADDPRYAVFAVSHGEFPPHRLWRVDWDHAPDEARKYAPLTRWRLARED